MATEGQFTSDGSTDWQVMEHQGHVHIAGAGTFGSGTVTIQQQINGTTYSVLDSSQTALTFTAAFDEVLYFGAGDRFRLNLASSTTPALDYKMAGTNQNDY